MGNERLNRVISASVNPTARLSSALPASKRPERARPPANPATRRRGHTPHRDQGSRHQQEPPQTQSQPDGTTSRGDDHLAEVRPREEAARFFRNLLTHLGYKAITPFGNRLDVVRRRSALPEQLAQNGDVEREVIVLDERIGPDFPHQIVSIDDPASVLDQHNKHVKRFGSKRQGLPALSIDRSTVLSRNSPNSYTSLHLNELSALTTF